MPSYFIYNFSTYEAEDEFYEYDIQNDYVLLGYLIDSHIEISELTDYEGSTLIFVKPVYYYEKNPRIVPFYFDGLSFEKNYVGSHGLLYNKVE